MVTTKKGLEGVHKNDDCLDINIISTNINYRQHGARFLEMTTTTKDRK